MNTKCCPLDTEKEDKLRKKTKEEQECSANTVLL